MSEPINAVLLVTVTVMSRKESSLNYHHLFLKIKDKLSNFSLLKITWPRDFVKVQIVKI